MALAEELTNIGLVTDAVISTVTSSAVLWSEYPFNLIIGVMIFGVGFSVVRKVLHR
jgi:hypothetical protein